MCPFPLNEVTFFFFFPLFPLPFLVPCNCSGAIRIDEGVSLEFEEVCESEDEDSESPKNRQKNGANEVLEK